MLYCKHIIGGMKMFKTIKTLIFLAKHYQIIIDSEHNYTMNRINNLNREMKELKNVIEAQTSIKFN